MSRSLFVALLAGAALAAPSTAAAAPPWSAPVDLGPGVATIADPALDFAAPGVPLFSYRFTAAEPAGLLAPAADRSAIAVRHADGRITRSVLSDDAIAQARCGQRCWAVLRMNAPARADAAALLRVSIGSGPGALGRPRTLARYRGPEDYDAPIVGSSRPQIAALPSGAIAIAWIEAARRLADGSTRGAQVRLALREPGRSLGRPRTIAVQTRGTLRAVRLAFHARNAVTATYVREDASGTPRRRTVEARVVPLRGRTQRAQTIGPAPESYTDLRVRAIPGGRTVIAWGNVHGTVMGAESRWTVRAALRAPGGRRFARAQVLDPGIVQVGAPGAIGVGVASDGTATVAWSAWASASLKSGIDARVASAPPGRRFAAPQVLATAGSNALADLVVASNGAAVATWTTFSAEGVRVMAATRAASRQAFGATEIVAQLASRSFNPLSPDPDAAYEEATRRFSIIWATDESTGTPPQHAPGSARLQLATRLPAG